MLNTIDTYFKKYILLAFYFVYFCYLYYDLSFGTNSSTFFYVSFIIFVLLLPIIKKRIEFNFSWVDLIPTSILLSGAVGVITAFHYHIEPRFILRNSVGLFMFASYFVFPNFFKPEELSKDLKNISIMANMFILASLFFRNEFFILGLGSQRFIYSPLLVFAFVVYPYLLNHLFDQLFINKLSFNEITFTFINLMIVFFNVYLISLSKGALLGILVISLLYMLLKFYHLKQINIDKLMLFFSLLYFTFIVCLTIGIFDKIFGTKDISNQSRFLQNDYLFRETSFWGNGLGSYLLNGFYRDENLKYAYEATFFNFWNKLGVFWFIILSSFLYAILLLFKKNILDSKSLICLGTFFYILISLGNPTLFGPSYVILACLGLNLIRNDFSIRKNTLELK